MKSIIINCDLFSHNATLTFNEKGDTGYKTFIGGIISIISTIFSILNVFYFIQRIFSRKDITILTSTQINPFVNLTYSHKLPFLIRLTDTNSIPYEDDEKLYYITASIWYGGSNDSSLLGIAPQNSVSLNISKCDINKHFNNEFKDYFRNISDLNSYYCLEPRNYSQTIYGLYGNIYPFSYYSFTVRYCQNSTENNNICYSIDDIKERLDFNFLDIIFIDNIVNSFEKKVNEIYIRKERYELSSLLIKRIWLYLENIKYITDTGYIINRAKNEYFHRYNSVKTDYNIKNNANFFCTLTFLNEFKTSTYIKQFKKIQDYIAIIGGLVKFITLFSTLLNYYNSNNSYYLKLIQDFIIENKRTGQNIKNSKRFSYHFTAKKYFNKYDFINNQSSNETLVLKKNRNINNSLKNNSKLQSNYNFVNSSVSTRILPSIFCKNKKHDILFIYKEFINDRLNVIHILKKLETIEITNELKLKSISDPIINKNNIHNSKLKLKIVNFKK